MAYMYGIIGRLAGSRPPPYPPLDCPTHARLSKPVRAAHELDQGGLVGRGPLEFEFRRRRHQRLLEQLARFHDGEVTWDGVPE